MGSSKIFFRVESARVLKGHSKPGYKATVIRSEDNTRKAGIV